MTETSTNSTATARFCRRCGHPVSRVSHCQRCGEGVVRDGAAAPRRFVGWCDRCNHDLVRDAAFCGGCGKRIRQSTPPPLPPQPASQMKGLKAASDPAAANGRAPARHTGAGSVVLVIAIVASISLLNRRSTRPPRESWVPATPASPDLPVPRVATPESAASITDPKPRFNVLAPDGRVGVRVTARCRVPGGGRGRLVAHVMQYPSERPVQTIYQDVRDFDGSASGADCSLVIPYELLHPVPVDNSFYLVLAIEDDRGHELARAGRLRVDYKQGISAVTRVRASPGSTDSRGRRGVRFTADFVYGALYGRRCSVLLYFKDPATGKPLRSRERSAADRSGNLVILNERTISQIQRTEYKGIDLFLPADALPLGVRRLRAEAVLWDPDNKQYLSDAVPFDVDLPDAGDRW